MHQCLRVPAQVLCFQAPELGGFETGSWPCSNGTWLSSSEWLMDTPPPPPPQIFMLELDHKQAEVEKVAKSGRQQRTAQLASSCNRSPG